MNIKSSEILEVARIKETTRLSKTMPYCEASRCVDIMVSEGIQAFHSGATKPLTSDKIMSGVFIGEPK